MQSLPQKQNKAEVLFSPAAAKTAGILCLGKKLKSLCCCQAAPMYDAINLIKIKFYGPNMALV